jgi:hypothetical protein
VRRIASHSEDAEKIIVLAMNVINSATLIVENKAAGFFLENLRCRLDENDHIWEGANAQSGKVSIPRLEK